VLFAHDALDPPGVGDTPALINIGKADLGTSFFLLGELSDSSGGAYLTAEGTVVLTVADSEVEPS